MNRAAPPLDEPVKVAIVGGGCAAMATAFDLTRAELDGRYEVTIYQQGWRLGGKGASGRGPNNRIEEHGLHLWHGWYENAFRLVRECYAELGRDPSRDPMADWTDAFSPAPIIGLADRSNAGFWDCWAAAFPPSPGLPGDPLPVGEFFSPARYLSRAMGLAVVMMSSVSVSAPSTGRDAARHSPGPEEPIGEAIARVLRYGQLASQVAVLEGARLLETALRQIPGERSALLRLTEWVAAGARGALRHLAQQDDEIRRVWQIVDMVLCSVRGAIRHGVLTDPRGFDSLDDYDYRDWLRLHGASEETIDSTFVNALYDMAFAYEKGDPRRPRGSAGVLLRGGGRFFLTYRGSLFWRMNTGMGDAVFAPFYQVLKRRGVAFRFFHRLENVELAKLESLPGETPHVAALDFRVQAQVKSGDEYSPLIDVDGLPCWPSEPDTDQLVGSRRKLAGIDYESHWDETTVGRARLEVGHDFDAVVLAIGLGAVPHVCSELIESDSRWREMVEHVGTTRTQAFQLWLDRGLDDLGWPHGTSTVTGFEDPIDTWADMSHLVGQEDWRGDVQSILYFCGVLSERPLPHRGPHPEGPSKQVKADALEILEGPFRAIAPGAYDRRGSMRWNTLVNPEETAALEGPARFDGQFWTANINPSDGYVLSLPGSQRFRISPLDRTYDNLTIAGDWTECGINAGCVEAAILSGRLAAHAIAGTPRLMDIVGYDHP